MEELSQKTKKFNETILIIDDDQQLLLLLSAYLKNIGYQTLVAQNGKEGIDILKKNIGVVNLIIVDIAMPILNGIEVCEIIRKNLNLKTLPIIMLTSMLSIHDKYNGFHAGADDYLTKPFEPLEIQLRIESLFNRRDAYTKELSPKLDITSTITIDKENYTVIIKGTPVYLTKLEFELISYLFDNANKYVAPEIILENVFNYPSGSGTTDTIRTHIRNLRIKLEEDPTNPKIITNLLKRGYMLKTDF